MCPYAVVSLQKSIGGSDPQKPVPQNANTRKGAPGGEVNGGLARGCTIVHERRVSQWRAPRTKPRGCVDQTCRGEPQATKSPKTRAHVGCNHRASGPQENPTERSVGETWGQRVCNRRPTGRKKSSTPPIDGRRLGPGKAMLRHGRMVEAVSAIVVESVNHTRTAKKARTGIRRGLRQGCQRYGRRRAW